jgi:Cys-tRNA(Pro)/Cys-tRNA(Cys) deacylase
LDIEYEIKSYNPNTKSVKEAAYEMNINIDNMLKTILVRNNEEYKLVLIPINKKITNLNYKLADRNCIEDITGYVVGSVSPFLLKNKLSIIIDPKINNMEKISISTGIKGYEVILKTKDLINITSSTFDQIYD